MGSWGGARPGAGRKPKVVEDRTQSILAEIFNEDAERKVVRAMITAATRDRSVAAATWLYDRKFGKVKEQVEQSGGLTVRFEYDNDHDQEA
jgi:hypothetical protein